MKLLILSTWLFLTAVLSHGQSSDPGTGLTENSSSLESRLPGPRDPSTLPATREYASDKVEVRKFDQKRWREIVEARNYTDTRTRKPRDQKSDTGPAGPQSGTREMQSDDEDQGGYEYDVEEDPGTDLSWLGPLGQVIFYGAIIAVIVVILMQIVRNTSFRSNPKKTSAPFTNVDDIHDITELDTEGLIRKAQDGNDYKLAIRLYFLDLLKKLNENGMIVWTKDKTNRDFLSELFSKQYYFDEIRRLTLAYERVWYGEHVPTEERYHELRSEFQAVNQKLKAS